MRADHQVVRAWVNDEVMYGCGRDAVLELRPGPAAVHRDEHAVLRTDNEQVWIAMVLADHVHRAFRQIARDRRPGTAEVRALVHIRLEVVVAVTIERRVRGA